MLESKTFLVWFGATLLMCAISCGQGLSAQEILHSIAKPVDTYRIGAGDRIQLDVWRHPELTKTVVVDRVGNITLPSIHVVRASGLSVMDLAGLVRHKLGRKIPNLEVTVTVVGIGSHWTPLPQPLQRDLPSPELRQGCCVAQIDAVTMAKS